MNTTELTKIALQVSTGMIAEDVLYEMLGSHSEVNTVLAMVGATAVTNSLHGVTDTVATAVDDSVDFLIDNTTEMFDWFD